MQTKNPMKLGTRLALAFACLVLIACAVGAFGLAALSRLNTVTVNLADGALPSVRVLGEMRTYANQIRRAEADVLLSIDKNDMAASRKRIEEVKATLADRTTAYEALIDESGEREKLEAFKKARDAYFAIEPRMLDMGEAFDTRDEALKIFRGDSNAAFRNMVEQIGALVQINDASSKAAAAASRETYRNALVGTFAIIAVALVVAAVLAVWVVRGVTRRLGGEPGEAAELAQRVADGDLSVPITVRAGDDSSLLAALKRMQKSLAAIVHGVRSNAESVATASGQISQGNSDLSSRTEEQASALQQTAASMKQLAATVQQNAEHARQGNELAVNASDVAARGGEVVGQVVETMKGINDSSRKIADIIGVIDGIAFQTNILALNAAVEAARAGEQGRGFAVVASEVRSLAQRSADAAKEIKGLITASVERVEQGSQLADQAGATMAEVVQSISRVKTLMGEISEASNEQSAGVAQVGDAVQQMDQATQQNAALVEESAAAADSLKGQAQQLVSAVSVFKLDGAPASNEPMALLQNY